MKSEHVQRVWSRELPGGGFTAIDIATEHSMLLGAAYHHGVLIVERRAEPRRAGHTPPVVAEAEATTIESIIRDLLPTAQSNSALGWALLKRKHARA